MYIFVYNRGLLDKTTMTKLLAIKLSIKISCENENVFISTAGIFKQAYIINKIKTNYLLR